MKIALEHKDWQSVAPTAPTVAPQVEKDSKANAFGEGSVTKSTSTVPAGHASCSSTADTQEAFDTSALFASLLKLLRYVDGAAVVEEKQRHSLSA